MAKYTVLNGVLYIGAGVLIIAWPGAVQTLFRDAPFVGDEGGLFRIVGLLLVVVGWFYFFGVRSGARQAVAASIVDRLVFVPLIFFPLAIAGVDPHLLVTFAIIDLLLGIGAWILVRRKA